MKKLMMILMAATLLAASMPAFAATHGGSHDPADVQCAKDCEMLLKNCALEVDTIQQKITKLRAAIKKDGADQQKLAEIKVLKQKLEDAEATLKALETPGR
jgi:seryl-tRNA synthetase